MLGVAGSNLAVATKFAGLAKLVDAPDLGSGAEEVCGFKSLVPHHLSACSQIVVGVSPSGKAPGFESRHP